MNLLTKRFGQLFSPNNVDKLSVRGHFLHTTAVNLAMKKIITEHWLSYNKKVFPPQSLEETPRPAVCSFINFFI